MVSTGGVFTHPGAGVDRLVALTSSCGFLITGQRQATSLRVSFLSFPLGHRSTPRHERAPAGPIRTFSKIPTIQNTNSPARAPVPGFCSLHPYDTLRTISPSPTLGGVAACVLSTMHLPWYAMLPRRHLYWPPPRDQRSRRIKLPSGKKCFVFNAKRDQDGKLEPVVCFVDSQDNLLMWFDQEEFLAFESLIPRLQSYYELWEAKARRLQEEESHEDESFHAPGLD